MRKQPFKIYGILGHPLSHSLSPVMQEMALSAREVKGYYLKLDLEPQVFRKVCARLKKAPLDGFNVTVPYKEKILRYLDFLTPEARRIGAVNTVFRQGGKWAGANTDVDGFLKSLKVEGRFSPKGREVLVLGAGGAARAVVYGLASAGASKINVLNRRPGRAASLVNGFKKQFRKTAFHSGALDGQNQRECLSSSSLIVNTTSLGLKRTDASPVDFKRVPEAAGKKRKLFFDLIYFPCETRFLKLARKKGHRVLNGRGMLIFQGAKAFEYWTGLEAPAKVMAQALQDHGLRPADRGRGEGRG